MRPALALAAALPALAACAPPPAVPELAILDRDLLTVRMSDGSTCRGPAPGDAPETGWSGRLTDCPWTYAYAVEIDPGTNPLRVILEEILGERFLSPFATVTIVDAAGRTRTFQSPEAPPD